jgi:hypothetical protein
MLSFLILPLAVTLGLAGAALIEAVAKVQKPIRCGARCQLRRAVAPAIIAALAIAVALMLTGHLLARSGGLSLSSTTTLTLLALGSWLTVAWAAQQLLRAPIAWQSGFLILRGGRHPADFICMDNVQQIRLMPGSFRLMLRDGRHCPVRLDAPGGRDLLHALLAHASICRRRRTDFFGLTPGLTA